MRILSYLDQPLIWRMSRFALNLAFGLYRKRFRTLQRWGVLANAPSLLDIGCGTGQYARASAGRYVGIDLNARYIQQARKCHPDGDKNFYCLDASNLPDGFGPFDIVLFVDFLHHLSDRESVQVLRSASRVARRCVISFEPVLQQSNPLGRWIIENDRGHHMRPLDSLHDLFGAAGLRVTESLGLHLGPINTRAVLCDFKA